LEKFSVKNNFHTGDKRLRDRSIEALETYVYSTQGKVSYL